MVYELTIPIDDERELKVYEDRLFRTDSPDNVHNYDRVHQFEDRCNYDFTHGIGLRLACVDGTSTSCLLVARGVCTCRVASDYVALVRSRVHVAVGYYVCAVELNGWSWHGRSGYGAVRVSACTTYGSTIAFLRSETWKSLVFQ